MTDENGLSLRLTIPAGWLALPRAESGTGHELEALVDPFELADDARERLIFGLSSVTAVAHSNERTGQLHWAYVPEPASGRVEALMSFTVRAAMGGDRDRYLERATAETTGSGDAELISRNVEARTLPAGEAVSIHDFVIEPVVGGVPNPAVERAFVFLFIAGAPRVLEYSIVTQNLAMFEDITEYLVNIASAVHPDQVAA